MKEYPVKITDRSFIIQVGENARENWELIDYADKFDLWFYLDNVPSGHVVIKEILTKKIHVVIKNDIKDDIKNDIKNDFFGYPHELIHMACLYCKAQSKYKNNKTTVIYTTIANVKKEKNIGSVSIKNSKYVIL